MTGCLVNHSLIDLYAAFATEQIKFLQVYAVIKKRISFKSPNFGEENLRLRERWAVPVVSRPFLDGPQTSVLAVDVQISRTGGDNRYAGPIRRRNVVIRITTSENTIAFL